MKLIRETTSFTGVPEFRLSHVLPVTTRTGGATYQVMVVTDDVLVAMFAAWRAEIDSVSYAHESECAEIIRGFLGTARQRCPTGEGGSGERGE